MLIVGCVIKLLAEEIFVVITIMIVNFVMVLVVQNASVAGSVEHVIVRLVGTNVGGRKLWSILNDREKRPERTS
jgi:hypothetical protein